MKAIRCREWGAAGVNFADSLMVGGTYQVKPPFPFTRGSKPPARSSRPAARYDNLSVHPWVRRADRNL